MEFRKNDLIEVEGFDDGASTEQELMHRKKSVKKMLRPHKAEQAYRGRAKISMLFARVGIYLHI